MQIPLPLNPLEIYHFSNFYFGDKPELTEVLTAFSQHKNSDFIYVCAPTGEGKSHLAMACVQAGNLAGNRTGYLPLNDLVAQQASPGILAQLEQLDMLCVDDMDAIAGLPAWEEALFHTFNRLQQAGCALFVTAKTPPHALALRLADLASRLATGTVYQLPALDDLAKQQTLVLQATSRDLDLSMAVADYMLRHYGRDMPSLMRQLKQLDTASFSAKRKLTISFVKQVLADAT